ncbi:peroxidase family protein [Jiangella mangrovi]|uniref:Ca2+-binding RTX toxin-like protein n=1 Tax=Jiangella mangrovi TaxID=1524084 RepID=A0A7W9GSJ2_9ACTN|nr:Ca2+-binding RTX toxin-like protein [Jiangella mangrovi]
MGTPHRPRGRLRPGLALGAAAAVVLGLLPLAGTATVAGAAPEGFGFTLNAGDLRFILRQIEIAENHATKEGPDGEPVPGEPLLGSGPNQVANPLLPYGLRTVDGSYNNLVEDRAGFGASHELFPRLSTPHFRDAEDGTGFGPPGPTSYTQKSGVVVDSEPRRISNLIADQTSANPAAVKAATAPHRTFLGEPVVPCESTDPDVPEGCIPPGETLPIPNVSTDVGLSPPFNSWFTLFGQFFDHGIDFTVKGGGAVVVPLQPGDQLIAGDDGVEGTADDLPPNQRFMVVTRAKNQPGPDGVMGTADDVQEATNTDSPWVDQSQTYASHPSHHVFLREYELDDDGRTVATGAMLELDGGMPTWATVKQQSRELLGIDLTDADVADLPLLLTDQYGRYLRGPERGLPQLVMADGTAVEGDLAAPIPTTGARRISVAFLDDIAHTAAPRAGLVPDADSDLTPTTGVQPAGTYDDEMLDAHYIGGDGRLNENIGLTAVHQVFHSEHNRLAEYIKELIVAEDVDVEEWQLENGDWNGERIFQAARFVTEMEYQHIVFEDFARTVQPGINPFNVFTQSDTAINPAVTAEFAHAVYRFGHSMLTDTISRTRADGTVDDISLLEGFLNPPAYTNGGTISPAEAAGSIAMGMTDQAGAEIDEFVTETLRNNLLGLPLDLASINLTRAREAGIPSLNAFRRELYEETQESSLRPYSDWVDFGQSLKHLDSVVNFMAAYGTHPSIVAAATNDEKRAAAQLLFDNDPALNPATPADAYDFVNGVGAWASEDGVTTTGVDGIDLWIGGLAESTVTFGGMLGSTFNYVFERQLTDLQDGDRLYYLSRTAGLNLRTQLEGNSFAEMVMRNTTAQGLKAHVFSVADCEFDLANLQGSGNTVADDPLSECDESRVLYRMADGTIRYRQSNTVDPPGLNAQSTYNGTPGNDRMWGGVDDDTFWGNDGDDTIEGSDGIDTALGGRGDDVITDSAGDDVHKGGPGNDAIDTGPGLDIIMSGDGHDFTNGGLNANETFAGEGNDFVVAGGGADTVFGGGGHDWQEGGNGNDLLQGDSGAPFFDDINAPGDDVLIGGSNEDDYDAEGGDDIMVAGAGIERNHGARGFDWVTHAREPVAADSDLTINVLDGPPALADRFLLTEALSGWDKNDVLRGDDLVPYEADTELEAPWGSNVLTPEGIEKIDGLAEIVDGHTECRVEPGTEDDPHEVCGFGAGNILLGGGGSDLLEGRGADDLIDGDAWVNHRLSVRTDPADPATEVRSATQLSQLSADVFRRIIDPADIVIVKEVLTAGPDGIDTAVFSGPLADYDVDNTGPALTVTHARNIVCCDEQGDPMGDGTDTITNVERLQFADQVVEVSDIPTNAPPEGTVTLSDTTPTENQELTATRDFTDADGIDEATVVLTWQAELDSVWTGVGTGATFTPSDDQVGAPLRVVVTYTDGDGVVESVTSAATAAVANVNDVPTGVPAILDITPQEDVASTVSTALIADGDGLPATLDVRWQASTTPTNNTYADIAGATGTTFTPTQAQVNRKLRAVVTYTDGNGTAESIASAPTGVVGDLFIGSGAPETWTGTAGDDRAYGRGGNDTLNGGSGDDVIAGETGNDIVNGGAGDDTFQVTGTAHGWDSVTGAAGTDRVVATTAGTLIGLASVASVEEVSAEPVPGGGVLENVEVNGSNSANTLSFAPVTLTGIVHVDGLGGDDSVTGNAADDVLRGGAANDTVNGAGGNDALHGDAGADTLNGAAGDDVLEGGAGNDALVPGPGFDVLAYGTGTVNVDTVTGFDANPNGGGQDLIDLSARGITPATFGSSVTITQGAGFVQVQVGAGNQIRLTGLTAATVTQADFVLD